MSLFSLLRSYHILLCIASMLYFSSTNAFLPMTRLTHGRGPLAANPALNSNLIISMMLSPESGRNLKIHVNGFDLSYDLFRPQTQSANAPAIIYLPGLIRQKNEAKSINLQALCKRSDLTFLCADYVGVGRSSGQFQDGSVGKWASDTAYLINKLITPFEKKVILVGHGVGAWVSMVVATKNPEAVKGIVGMSADPDFTEELLWKKLDDDVKSKIMSEGSCEITWGKDKYLISKNLIEDGRKNLLLAGGPGSIPISCPVRLIHGLADEEVPFTLALKLIDNLASKDASVVLLKDALHAMDSESDLKTMRSMLAEVLESFGDFDLRSPGSG